jgi:hypothetical protein
MIFVLLFYDYRHCGGGGGGGGDGVRLLKAKNYESIEIETKKIQIESILLYCE